MDARGSLSPPSSSRSGDPTVRRRAVRHHGRGDPNPPSFRGRSPWNPLWRGNAKPWTRRPKLSVIQRGAPAPRGIPRSGAAQYVAVTPVEPTGGLRRRKVRSTPLPPYGESFSRSLAPPSRPKSRRYAAVGLETRLRAQFSDAIRFAGFASETRVVACAGSE